MRGGRPGEILCSAAVRTLAADPGDDRFGEARPVRVAGSTDPILSCVIDWTPGPGEPTDEALGFHVLGPIEVVDAGGPVTVGGPKERMVLAHLLARLNTTVSMDALVEGVWAGDPPRSADRTMRSYVARLRKALAPDRLRGTDHAVLLTEGRGYRLQLRPNQFDALRFEDLARRAPTSSGRATRSRPAPCARRWGCGRATRTPSLPTSTRSPPRPAGSTRCGWWRSRTGSTPTWAAARVQSWWPRSKVWWATIPSGNDSGVSSCSACTDRVASAAHWPRTNGPGRCWTTSSASSPGPSCGASRRPSSPRIRHWTFCAPRPRTGPAACRSRWRRSARPSSAGTPNWNGCARAGPTQLPAGAGSCHCSGRRAWARPAWSPSSPAWSTPRAGSCCTGGATTPTAAPGPYWIRRCAARGHRWPASTTAARSMISPRPWPASYPTGRRGGRCWSCSTTSTWPTARRSRWSPPSPDGARRSRCWSSGPSGPTRRHRPDCSRRRERHRPSSCSKGWAGPRSGRSASCTATANGPPTM